MGLTSTPQLAPLSLPFAQSLRAQSRSKHTVPPLTNDFVDEGIPGFLSPGAFEMAWTQYQTLMLEKLDQKTAGMLTWKSVLGGILHRGALERATKGLDIAAD